MAEVICPENILEEIEVSDLLRRALELKKAGFRHMQYMQAKKINTRLVILSLTTIPISYTAYVWSLIWIP